MLQVLAPETPAVWHLLLPLPSVVGDCTSRDLGAQISAQLSYKLEVDKSVDAARTVGTFQYCCKSAVSLTRKVLVFKSVVNEALLSALEVRALDDTDLQGLEAARGLLPRLVFGKMGFGT